MKLYVVIAGGERTVVEAESMPHAIEVWRRWAAREFGQDLGEVEDPDEIAIAHRAGVVTENPMATKGEPDSLWTSPE